MSLKEQQLAATNNDFSAADEVQVPDVKQHWPTWAIVLFVACILITILAFLLGNCITKRAAPLRPFKAAKSTQRPENRRMWGAGFSGGLWAAA